MNEAALWEWAVRTYAAPEVAPTMLALQDRFGAHVPLLLWSAKLAADGKRLSAPEAAAALAALASLTKLVRDLRAIRRSLKQVGGPAALGEAAQASVGDAERSVERLELAILAARAEAIEPAADADASLLTANLRAGLAAAGVELARRDAAEALEAAAAAIAATVAA